MSNGNLSDNGFSICSLSDAGKELFDILNDEVNDIVPGQNAVAVALSGGLDSTVVLAFSLKHRPSIPYTVGTPESTDIQKGTKIAKHIGCDAKQILIDDKKIEVAVSSVTSITGITDPVRVSILVPLYFVLSHAEEEYIITGQGADELFGGYHRYLSLQSDGVPSRMNADLEFLINTGLESERRIANGFNKHIVYPYLQNRVIKFVKSLPIDYKIAEGQRKIILRHVAKLLGLPDEVINSEKKAAQYSSGVMKGMKRLAKRSGMNLENWILRVSEICR